MIFGLVILQCFACEIVLRISQQLFAFDLGCEFLPLTKGAPGS